MERLSHLGSLARQLVVVKSGSIKAKVLEKGVNSVRLITGPKDASDRFMMSLLTVEPGASSEGIYEDKDEALYILQGRLSLEWDGKAEVVGPGDAVFIPMGQRWDMENKEEVAVKLIAIISPSKKSSEL